MLPKPSSKLRRFLLIASGLVLILVTAVYAYFPWIKIRDLKVTSARIVELTSKEPDSSPQTLQDHRYTKQHYVVEFSSAFDLVDLQKKKDVGILNANLFDCENKSLATSEVISQRAEYVNDRGRVSFVSKTTSDSKNEQYNYLVKFDARLRHLIKHEFVLVDPATVLNGLCFGISGGSMWFGAVWSDRIRLNLTRKN